MIVPLIRMTAKALADATLGVNAQIAALTLDATLAGVTDTRPPNIVTIKNQADHNLVVDEAAGDAQYPLIVVAANDPFTGHGQIWTSIQDLEGDVHCVYVTRGGVAATNFLDTNYSLRAMKKAVHAYLLASGTRDTNGRRNNVAIKTAPRLSFGLAQGDFMGGQVGGVLKITFEIRDFTP